MMQEGMAKQKTAKPVIGGVLILLGGIVNLFVGIPLATIGTVYIELPFFPTSMFLICGAIWITLGLIAIIGGIFAIKREKFGLAIISGVLTVYTIFSLIGLILVALSKDEFT